MLPPYSILLELVSIQFNTYRPNMQDQFSTLLGRYPLQARVFYSGALCGTSLFDDNDGVGHLHVIRNGQLRLRDGQGETQTHAGPCLIYYTRPIQHWIESDHADLVCASVGFGANHGNPLAHGLPDVLALNLDSMSTLSPAVDMLFDEAFHQRVGRQAALDRLSEIVILQLLRHAMDAALIDKGVLAGLGDAKLSKALDAIHQQPGEAWSLQSLADVSGMSRSRFSSKFLEVVGVTPGDYLTDWRLGIAKTLLRQGRPVKHAAHLVGYADASAMARAFAARHGGTSPTKWLKDQALPA